MVERAAEPRFLSPAGEQAWVRLRRHLDRASRFWLAFVLTDDPVAADVLRERAEGNRRLRAEPVVTLRPRTPDEFAAMVASFERRAAQPPGCTIVTPPRATTAEWLQVWRELLYLLNHRRDLLRRRLGGIVLVAPPAVKAIAQRETTDLWSVVDLLVELPAPPAGAVGHRLSEPAAGAADTTDSRLDVAGLDLGDVTDKLADEAAVLLALPREDLATAARARVTGAIGTAHAAGANQLAAVLLLAQADGYRLAGDFSGALGLLRVALQLDGVDDPARIRLVDSAAELAAAMGDLVAAAGYATESVELTRSRSDQLNTPQTLRDLSVSLNKLANIDYDRGDLDTAHTRYTESLQLRQRLANQLNTPGALRDLAVILGRLAVIQRERGNSDEAGGYQRQADELRTRLEAVGDDG
jgi:tetratricopeptide (TPR) repeat protein